jgi:hypothetical protein
MGACLLQVHNSRRGEQIRSMVLRSVWAKGLFFSTPQGWKDGRNPVPTFGHGPRGAKSSSTTLESEGVGLQYSEKYRHSACGEGKPLCTVYAGGAGLAGDPCRLSGNDVRFRYSTVEKMGRRRQLKNWRRTERTGGELGETSQPQCLLRKAGLALFSVLLCLQNNADLTGGHL